VIREEISASWWRHLLVSLPLAWCGMWVGWIWALLTIPLFGYACWGAVRRRRALLLLYITPAMAMLVLHAAMANQSTRYNLILIGPFAAGASVIVSAWLANLRRRSKAFAARL